MVRFDFNTIDNLYDGFRGWLVDDVSVSTPFSSPAPQVSAVNPSCVPTAGGVPVDVTGSNFVLGSTVTLDGGQSSEQADVPSDQKVQFQMPALSAGSHTLQVSSPNGAGSNSVSFQVSDSCGTPPPPPPPPSPTNVSATSLSGGAVVSWQENAGAASLSGFTVQAVSPSGTPGQVVANVGPGARSAQIGGLRNCMPTRFAVRANGPNGNSGLSVPGAVVVPHEHPPNSPKVVVILMEGVDSVTKQDVYDPAKVPSYCYASDGAVKTTFPVSLQPLMDNFNPYYDLNAAGGPASMTDTLVAQGGVIFLPWSFNGVWIGNGGHSVHANASTAATSDQNPIDNDALGLQQEVASAHAAWPSARIAIVAHSLGGLIAEQYWEYYWRSNHQGVTRIIALDAPLNGIKLVGPCALIVKPGPCPNFSYSVANFLASLWTSMEWHDPAISANDGDFGFLPVGTEGDSAYALPDAGTDSLISQLLFACGGWPIESCSPLSPGFVSPCPSSDHGEVKACPGIISYVDKAIFGSAAMASARRANVREPRTAVATAASHRPRDPVARLIAGRPWARPTIAAVPARGVIALRGDHLGANPGSLLVTATGNKTAAAQIVAWSDTSIRAQLPITAISGPLTLTTAIGAPVPVDGISVLASPNGVTHLSVTTQRAGEAVRLIIAALSGTRKAAGKLVSLFDGFKTRMARTNGSGHAVLILPGFGLPLRHTLEISSGLASASATATWAAAPALKTRMTAHPAKPRPTAAVRVIGIVTHQSSGRPAGHVAVVVYVQGPFGPLVRFRTVHTDSRGKFFLQFRQPRRGAAIATATTNGVLTRLVIS